MARSIAVAYGIAGTAVAAAVIVIAASTVGLAGGNRGGEIETGVVSTSGLEAGAPGSQIVTTASGEQVEYVYVDENGDPLTFEILTVSGWSDWVRAAQVISRGFADIGVSHLV